MKQFIAGALSSVLSFALGVLLAPAPEPKVTVFDRVECRRLSVRSGDGRHELRLVSGEDFVGVVVSNDATGNSCMIFTQDKEGPWIGISPRRGGPHGCRLAFTLEDGVPHLQMPRKDGKVSSLPLAER